jgi:hypothetical protein
LCDSTKNVQAIYDSSCHANRRYHLVPNKRRTYCRPDGDSARQGNLNRVPGYSSTRNDPKRALRQSPVLRFVPLTELQATPANRLAHLGRFNEAMHLLSPQRGSIFMQALKINAQISFKVVVDVLILPAWMSLCDKQVPSDGAPKTSRSHCSSTVTRSHNVAFGVDVPSPSE